MHTLSCVCVMDSWGLMNERVALQPRTRAADRNPIRISSPSAGRVVVDTGERGPHMLTILARIQLLNACIASNQAGRALLRMETEILRRRHESMRPHQPLAAVSQLGASAIMRAWETSSAVGSSFTAKILCI